MFFIYTSTFYKLLLYDFLGALEKHNTGIFLACISADRNGQNRNWQDLRCIASFSSKYIMFDPLFENRDKAEAS